MGMLSKGKLLFNTIKYLKPRQLKYQVLNRVTPRESFMKYYREGVDYKNYSVWISGLDDDSDFITRFQPNGLVDWKLTLLNETRDFTAWNHPDASHLWNFNIHYLEYLVALKAEGLKTGSDKYFECINSILNYWYEQGVNERDSNQAYTMSLRIVNMLLIADVVKGMQKFHDHIYAQYKFLLKHQEKHLLGNHYLENLKAIVICSVVFGEDDVYEKYIDLLLKELKEEITSDGLHFELSLMYHKIVLEDVMRVALLLREADKPEYQILCNYIKKMATALYSIEKGISRTPLFNDAGDNVAKPTKALLKSIRSVFNIEPENRDTIAGYYKLYDGQISLIADCGVLGPKYMSGHAHCDCLSFELFYGDMPVFVNSGTYQYQGKYRQHFRSTTAHNTVVINNHEQSELWGEHRAARRIHKIRGKISTSSIIGSYKNFCGEHHMRRIILENSCLEVLDQTSGKGVVQSYLHLAPGLKYQDGIITGNNLEIRVTLQNADMNVEESYYSEAFGIIENNECLVFSWINDNEKHGYKVEIKENQNG